MSGTITSTLYAPIVGAVYILALPLWLLITLVQWGTASPYRTWLMLGSVLLTALTVPLFFKGIMMLRQQVEVDAVGVRLKGFGGFDVPWSAVGTVSTQPQRTANLVITLRDAKVTSDSALGTSAVRHVGVQPEALDAILALAEAQGVEVEKPRGGR